MEESTRGHVIESYESFQELEMDDREEEGASTKIRQRTTTLHSVPQGTLLSNVNPNNNVPPFYGTSGINGKYSKEGAGEKNYLGKSVGALKSVALYTGGLVYYVFQLCMMLFLRYKRRIRRKMKLLGGEDHSIKTTESGIRASRENRLRRWIRKTWKNRRRHYKRFILAIIAATLSVFVCMYCYKYLLAALSNRASVGQTTTDDLDRVIENAITPVMLNKESPVDDPVSQYILSPSMSGTFETIGEERIKAGYAEANIPSVTVSFDYKVDRANISLVELYYRMMEFVTDKPKNSRLSIAETSCVCAAHYGIPLNIIMTGNSGKIKSPTTPEEAEAQHALWSSKLSAVSPGTIRSKTRMAKLVEMLVHKDNILFMIDPLVTSGSRNVQRAHFSDMFIPKGEKTEIKFPRSIWVKYIDIAGITYKTKLSGAQSMCTIRCVNIAMKQDIVNHSINGGIHEYYTDSSNINVIAA